MTFHDASKAIDRIADAGIKSPFTFWALFAVTVLAIAISLGSIWLLYHNLTQQQSLIDASQERYNRLFSILEIASQKADEREIKMIDELQLTRREYSQNLESVVQMLMEQSPTKADAELRQAALTSIQENREAMKKLELRQEKIGDAIQQLRLLLDGKTGR